MIFGNFNFCKYEVFEIHRKYLKIFSSIFTPKKEKGGKNMKKKKCTSCKNDTCSNCGKCKNCGTCKC